MKSIFILILLVFISPTLVEASDENDIKEVLAASAKAMTAKDVETYLNLWADDGEMITLAGGIFKGKTEQRGLLLETFSNPYPKAKYELVTHKIRLNGNLAMVDGIWKTYNAAPNYYPSCGIFIAQLIKEKDDWKIKLTHSSVPRQGHTAEHGRDLSWVEECAKSKK